MSKLKGWRTVGFNVGVAVLGILATADWGTLIPLQYAGGAAIAVAAVNTALRMVTTTSVGQR